MSDLNKAKNLIHFDGGRLSVGSQTFQFRHIMIGMGMTEMTAPGIQHSLRV